jgi:hypothetical protein
MRSHPARGSSWLQLDGGGDAPTTGGVAVTGEITAGSHRSIEHGITSGHAPISKHPMRIFGESQDRGTAVTRSCLARVALSRRCARALRFPGCVVAPG